MHREEDRQAQRQCDRHVDDHLHDRCYGQDLEREIECLDVRGVGQNDARRGVRALAEAIEKAEANEHGKRELDRRFAGVVRESAVKYPTKYKSEQRQHDQRRENRPDRSEIGSAVGRAKVARNEGADDLAMPQ